MTQATPAGGREAWDRRTLRLAVGWSLAGHVVILGSQLVLIGMQGPIVFHRPKLIYHREPVQSKTAWTREQPPSPAESHLKQMGRAAMMPGASGERAIRIGLPQASLPGLTTPAPSWGAGGSAPSSWEGSGRWATAIDLTNLTAAAQGNPLLYTYFGAIREQIQRTANGQEWLTDTSATTGVVCIGFVLNRSGDIESASIVRERSVDRPLLQEAALHIVQSAGPFPPFPPSFQDATKTIVIPIEFSAGTGS
jgi:TonB family protein